MIKNNCFCFIEKAELTEPFQYQKFLNYQEKFIVSQNITNNEEFKKIVNLSHYVPYIKYYNAKYEPSIMHNYFLRKNINKKINEI